MNKKMWGMIAVVCLLAVAAWTPAGAQEEPKEKPPLYSYVGFWAVPRPQWAEMEKQDAADQKVLDKALADGTIVGYGDDQNLVHQVDGATHDDWWSAMSMGALLSVLDKFYKSGSATAPVLTSATRHWDAIYVSRYYNWHPGSYKGAYTRVAEYKLRPDAPENAVEMLSRHLFVPLMEKLLADGTIVEYEIDTEAIHTDDPGNFFVVFITPTADGLDKFNAASREAHRMYPLAGQALDALVDLTPHRDSLNSSMATYK